MKAIIFHILLVTLERPCRMIIGYEKALFFRDAYHLVNVFLCDSTKFDKRSLYTLTPLDNVDFAVFDKAPKELRTSTTILLANV